MGAFKNKMPLLTKDKSQKERERIAYDRIGGILDKLTITESDNVMSCFNYHRTKKEVNPNSSQH